MESIILYIAIALGALVVGLLLGSLLGRGKNKERIESANKEAKDILRKTELEAEALKKEKMFQAKEHFIELKSTHERDINARERKMAEAENLVREKENKAQKDYKSNTDFKKNLERKDEILTQKLAKVETKEEQLEAKLKIQLEKLESIANLSADEAKNEMMESLKDKARTDAMGYIQNSIEEAKLTAQQEAKKIVINTIQRIGTEEAIDNCVSIFNLESDDVKGRIIGREGRNIRVLEAETGVEIIVDDTPEAIILSCFDPVRREIARLAMHRLVSDGRIHPARIEEVVNKTRKQVENEIIEVGKRTIIELGIHGYILNWSK